MPDPQKPAPFDPMAMRRVEPIRSSQPAPTQCENKEVCDRCGGEVYRMHAVWRCIKCGFKSDCCGW